MQAHAHNQIAAAQEAGYLRGLPVRVEQKARGLNLFLELLAHGQVMLRMKGQQDVASFVLIVKPLQSLDYLGYVKVGPGADRHGYQGSRIAVSAGGAIQSGQFSAESLASQHFGQFFGGARWEDQGRVGGYVGRHTGSHQVLKVLQGFLISKGGQRDARAHPTTESAAPRGANRSKTLCVDKGGLAHPGGQANQAQVVDHAAHPGGVLNQTAASGNQQVAVAQGLKDGADLFARDVSDAKSVGPIGAGDQGSEVDIWAMFAEVCNHGFKDSLVAQIGQAEVAGKQDFRRFHRPAIGVCAKFSSVRRRLGKATEDPKPRRSKKLTGRTGG